MMHMKNSRVDVLFIALVLLLLPWAGFASDSEVGGSDNPSTALSARMLCQTVEIFQSYIGMLVGMALALLGLYLVIRKGNLRGALILIIGGALISSLPTLIISGFGSFSQFLKIQGISSLDITPSLTAATSHVGSCQDIAADFSIYENQGSSVGSSASGSTGGGGTQSTAGVQSGMDPKGVNAARGGIGNPGGTVDPSAKGGGLGCGQLVKGGVPSSPFTTNRCTANGCRAHKGVDIGCAGRPLDILAAANGTVVYAAAMGTYGNRIEIDTGGGRINTYNHMSKLIASRGDTVSAGQKIGECGITGAWWSTGWHLHFEVKPGGNTFIDPVAAGCS